MFAFATGDRLLEEKVDEKLLINFRQCFRFGAGSETTLEIHSEANYKPVGF